MVKKEQYFKSLSIICWLIFNVYLTIFNTTIPPKKWVLLLSFWSKLYNWDSFLLKEWALLITMKKKSKWPS